MPRLVSGRPHPRAGAAHVRPDSGGYRAGAGGGRRARRAVELTLGVAFGVALADLLLSVVGVGAVQAGVLVVLAMGLAVFLGGGDVGVKRPPSRR